MDGYDAIIKHMQRKGNKGRKFIINISSGGGKWFEEYKRLKRIRKLGGIVFASAGNDNIDASNQLPAASPDTITVGSHDASNKRYRSSNYGTTVDIWGPGTAIISAKLGGGWSVHAGTSMAAPFVTGIGANILVNNPTLGFDAIKKKLIENAIKDVNDGRGNTNLPRAQSTCEEYCGSPGAKCKGM